MINKNWNKLQKYYDVYDSHIQIPNKIGYRRISLENNTNKKLIIAIYDKLSGGKPIPTILLNPTQVIHRAVNSPGSDMQYIRIFGFVNNTKNGINGLELMEIGEPSALQSTYNQFVIREGTGGSGPNHIFVHAYYQASYAA